LSCSVSPVSFSVSKENNLLPEDCLKDLLRWWRCQQWVLNKWVDCPFCKRNCTKHRVTRTVCVCVCVCMCVCFYVFVCYSRRCAAVSFMKVKKGPHGGHFQCVEVDAEWVEIEFPVDY
jgi:hypothetical protein